MITMETPFRPNWRRHRRAVSTSTIYRVKAMQYDEVQKQVAVVAKPLYQPTDELAVLIDCAITRGSWSSPRIFGCRRRGTAPDRVHAEEHRRVLRVNGADADNDFTALAVRQTVDRTPRGALNRPI
jgi:hypothetical protein